jgi:hypothetical protein
MVDSLDMVVEAVDNTTACANTLRQTVDALSRLQTHPPYNVPPFSTNIEFVKSELNEGINQIPDLSSGEVQDIRTFQRDARWEIGIAGRIPVCIIMLSWTQRVPRPCKRRCHCVHVCAVNLGSAAPAYRPWHRVLCSLLQSLVMLWYFRPVGRMVLHSSVFLWYERHIDGGSFAVSYAARAMINLVFLGCVRQHRRSRCLH